jgi:hypothetical protein
VFISSDGVAEAMLRHHHNVIAAARDAEVEHVVYTGIIDTRPGSGFYYASVHRETEAALGATGIPLCLAGPRSSLTSSSQPGSTRRSPTGCSLFRDRLALVLGGSRVGPPGDSGSFAGVSD